MKEISHFALPRERKNFSSFPSRKRHWTRSAFTLIERLVVIAIIAILAGLGHPSAYANGHGINVKKIRIPSQHMFTADDNACYRGAPNAWQNKTHYTVNGTDTNYGAAALSKLMEASDPVLVGFKHSKKSNILFAAGNVRPLAPFQVVGKHGTHKNYPWGVMWEKDAEGNLQRVIPNPDAQAIPGW